MKVIINLIIFMVLTLFALMALEDGALAASAVLGLLAGWSFMEAIVK